MTILARSDLPSWSLIVATLDRTEVLRRCLQAAIAQSVPPSDVVVVDASERFEDNKKTIAAEFSPSICLHYVKAEMASLTVQRNQGVALAQGTIFFLIDDDSVMYPDCAEQILHIYARDSAGEIAGVMAQPAPDPERASEHGPAEIRNEGSFLRRAAKRFLQTDRTYFLPYDVDSALLPLPGAVQGLNVTPINVMAGYAMTFRRNLFEKIRFSPLLVRYSAGEDQDFSYRASRIGALVVAHDAKLHHMEVPGGRLPRIVTTAMADLNPAALQVCHAKDLAAISRRWTKIVRKRLLIRFLKDLSERDTRFPRTRGTLIALRLIDKVYRCPRENLSSFYIDLQKSLIGTYV